jgi:hypothetical protein
VTLTATVTPMAATGAIQFKDGTADLGKPVVASNGAASTQQFATPSTPDLSGRELTEPALDSLSCQRAARAIGSPPPPIPTRWPS